MVYKKGKQNENDYICDVVYNFNFLGRSEAFYMDI